MSIPEQFGDSFDFCVLFPLNLSKKLTIHSGIGICLREDSLFGSVMMSFVLLDAVGHWIRCMVLLTVKIRFSRSISLH